MRILKWFAVIIANLAIAMLAAALVRWAFAGPYEGLMDYAALLLASLAHCAYARRETWPFKLSAVIPSAIVNACGIFYVALAVFGEAP